ncbi:NmrA family NAD(P)-binding protein, partial [Paenibacillus sonchi]
MKIALTGATGHFGSIVAETLLKSVAAENLVVSVRNPEKADNLRTRGVDVRHGDFDQPETLDTAFAGVDRLLIVSADGDNDTRIRQHKAAVDAAVRAKVGFIVYTSVGHADSSSLFLALVHRATEEFIRESGIPYSFLRNNWYLENEVGSIQAVQAGAPWVTSAGD